MIKSIILDFDGVILESVSVKTEAFQNLFSFRQEYVEEIVKFHIDNGGMSRYDKFRYIYTNILHEELLEEQFDLLCANFAELVYNGIISSSFVDGALKFLNRYYKIVPIYVVSATPEEELLDIINEREISAFFRKVYGAPKNKADCMMEILSSNKLPADTVIFAGDAVNDLKAAQKTGVRFIGRVKPGDENVFIGNPCVETVISDFDEFDAYIKDEVVEL